MKVVNKGRIRLLILFAFISALASLIPCNRVVFDSPIKDNIVKEFDSNKDNKNYKDEQLVVKFDKDDYKDIEDKYNVTVSPLSSDNYIINYDKDDYTLEQILNLLNKEENVAYAEPDYVFKSQALPTTEPEYSNQWAYNSLQYNINILDVWNEINDNNEVVVAVLDTGVDYNHPDLTNKIWKNTSETSGNGIDDDANGFIDDYQGWNFSAETNEIMDFNGHGTHIAGIIAGEVNDIGIAGVAPNIKVMSLRVANDSGDYYLSDVLSAIDYAISKGVKIFNFSFGAEVYIQSFKDAMSSKNALFVCAAGNGGVDEIGDDNDSIPFYPASYDLNNIVSVAATNNTGRLTTFSNYGATSVDLAAPGQAIYSTYLDDTYQYMSGTSMASPFVAAVAAILYSENTASDVLDIKLYLLSGSQNFAFLSDKVLTSGALDTEASYDGFITSFMFAGGSGTVLDPYLISNARQLDEVRNYLSSSFKLTNNINVSYNTNDQNIYTDDIGWLPIGTETDPFTGTFDGDDYKISGLTITRGTDSYIGLFGYVDLISNTNPNIYDLVLETRAITGKDYVGSLIGYGSEVNMQNVYVKSNINGEDYIGGIVGYATNSILNKVSSDGNINCSGDNVGGAIGYLEGTLGLSYNTSNVVGNINVGGLVGTLDGSIEDVFNMGMINEGTAISNVGGIVGNLTGTLNNSYNVGIMNLVTTGGTIGLITGSSTGTITNSYYYNPYVFTNNSYGTSLTKEQLYDIESYTGFDTTNDWEILSNNLLPTIKNNPFTLLTSYTVADSLSIPITSSTNRVLSITNNPTTNTRNNYIYISTDEGIVKVDKKGVLTPIGLGTTTITVYSIELNTSYEVEINVLEKIKGDVNGDFNVTVTDLVILRRYLAELQEIEDDYLINADVNDDTNITLTDLVKVRRYLAGLEEL